MNSRVIASTRNNQPLSPDSRSSDDELIALVALVQSHLLSPGQLSAAVDYFGSARTVLDKARRGELRAGDQQVLATIDAAVIDRAASSVGGWRSRELDVRTMLDDGYPRNLLSVHNRPPWLFVEGHWDPERDERAIAVVGTRKASGEGIARARRLSRELTEAGYAVISGMARGIDTAAHLAALDAGGRTVAVMGTGIVRRYPKENARLADAIIAAKCSLVSPFLPDQPPTKWTFPLRNVVMSGMCLATAVVEAGETSGAKLQAEAALFHGRSVFLPSSLVAAHAWARRMVESGMHGMHAVEVGSTGDIVKRLDLDVTLAPSVAV